MNPLVNEPLLASLGLAQSKSRTWQSGIAAPIEVPGAEWRPRARSQVERELRNHDLLSVKFFHLITLLLRTY